MSIGKRIKSRREFLNFTQEEVAKKVGVAIQTIFKYENEIVTNIPLDKIEKIALALNTTPSYIAGWETHLSSNANSSKLELLYSQLDTIDKGKAIGYIENMLTHEKYKKESQNHTA